jgi:transcriptional regulator with XRE-family HTH domain
MPPPRQPYLRAFGARVRRRRLELGLTQEALAERAGLHRTYIGMVERGDRNPTLGNQLRIARALQTDLGELVAGLERDAR